MDKMLIKLFAAGLSLMLAVTVAVTSSYAWLTLSDNPAANGIYIAIGGGNTILVAPDLSREVEGVVCHYPGAFSDTLNFAQYDSYDYLENLGGLTPVSTVDGINWVLPGYYQKTDLAVRYGVAQNGALKSTAQFDVDDILANANLTREQQELIDQGSYIYLDFWVVSPGADYRLRVSTGDGNGGSYAIGLMEPEETDADGNGIVESYQLTQGSDAAAASVRVGFLANQDRTNDMSMFLFLTSPGYSEQYKSLKGVYTEKGSGLTQPYSRFMIYEPNGTLHTEASSVENGSYVVTYPLDGNGVPKETDVSDRLTVQDTTTWSQAEGATLIEQVFQGTIAAKGFRSEMLSELSSEFYTGYLQGQVGAYVEKGSFFKNTANLYTYVLSSNATAQWVQEQRDLQQSPMLAGATDDVYIVDLERNVPQRIRMFVWLEGQDVDCTNEATQSALAISIELAGSNNGV